MQYDFTLKGNIPSKLYRAAQEVMEVATPTGVMVDHNAIHLRFTSPRNSHVMLTINDEGHALIGMLYQGRLITRLIGTNFDLNTSDIGIIVATLESGALDTNPSMIVDLFTLDGGSQVN